MFSRVDVLVQSHMLLKMLAFRFVVIFLNIYGFSNGSGTYCGKKVVASGFVVGGNESKKNEWPWLANLITLPSKKFFCGATIISERAVITAAHCIQGKTSAVERKISDFQVQLGKHSIKENEVVSQLFETEVIVVHPDWNPKDDRYDADLALLISRKAVIFSVNIMPVCLGTGSRSVAQSLGTVVGWGVSERHNSQQHENTPRQVQVKKISSEDCFFEYHLLASIASKRMFCVKGMQENSGPCLGDSGMWRNE